MILKNAKIKGKLTDIEIENGKIISVNKTDKNGVDLGGKTVIPGLIDIHTHGCIGCDTMDADFEKMCMFYAKNGTTSVYPTTMTVSSEDIFKVTHASTDVKGANILGFHLEGPYINEKYRGAQNIKFIKNPSIEEYNNWNENGNVKLITLAPEVDGAEGFIKNADCVVCLGHTDTDYHTAVKAINAGANCVTHIFNAMPPFHHRNPSLIGAAIDENIYAQVICDGVHIHKSVIKMLYRTFGSDRLILISDSLRATGFPDGEYEFGGEKITVKDKIARTKEGNLAGSTATLFGCVKKATEFGIPFDDAVKMATETPAKLMGINKGKIAEKYDADLIILNDELEIDSVIIGGEII